MVSPVEILSAPVVSSVSPIVSMRLLSRLWLGALLALSSLLLGLFWLLSLSTLLALPTLLSLGLVPLLARLLGLLSGLLSSLLLWLPLLLPALGLSLALSRLLGLVVPFGLLSKIPLRGLVLATLLALLRGLRRLLVGLLSLRL